VTVNTDVQIPDQPTTGAVIYQPLGGNGKTDPHAAYLVRIESTGDASGGFHSIRMRFDPKFAVMVSYVKFAAELASGVADVRIRYTGDQSSGIGGQQVFAACTTSGIGMGAGNQTAGCLWCPAPQIVSAGAGDVQDPPFLNAITGNTNGEVLELEAYMYLFDKRARELTPMSVLLGSLARGSTLSTSN